MLQTKIHAIKAVHEHGFVKPAVKFEETSGRIMFDFIPAKPALIESKNLTEDIMRLGVTEFLIATQLHSELRGIESVLKEYPVEGDAAQFLKGLAARVASLQDSLSKQSRV